EHQEGDLVGTGCRDGSDPAALADAPEPDALDVDGSQNRDRIVRLKVEPAARRVPRGLTLSAPVKGDDADPRRRQQLVEVRVERTLARPLAGSVQRDNRLLSSGRVARGQSEAVPLDLQLFQRSSFGNGREWTTTSVRVGRVRAT